MYCENQCRNNFFGNLISHFENFMNKETEYITFFNKKMNQNIVLA